MPTTITPTTFADAGLDSGSLRDAVIQFNADTGTDDDTIQLLAGTYRLTIANPGGVHETAGLTGDLNLTQASHRWIIQGVGPSTIIDAGGLGDRVFEIVTPGTQVVFRDLVIQGGLAQDDGSNGAQAGTTDALGGGILNNSGNTTLDDVILQNKVAQGGDAASTRADGHNARGGGLYSTGGALTMTGATITNNQAIGGRGGDHDGLLQAGGGGSAAGGGLYATGGSLDISSSMISSNSVTGGQGGDGSFYTTSPLTTGNGGPGGFGLGGGLYVSGGSLTIATSTIASNQATPGAAGLYDARPTGYGDGGGLDNLGTLTISNCTLLGNSANYGGGIGNSGTLTVSNSSLSGNSGYNGGGIANGDPRLGNGTLTVSNSTLSGNSAGAFGGGIENSGALTVSNSTLSANSAGGGGGILNLNVLTVSNSTLSGNSANYGGGIENSLAGPIGRRLTVSNSTLSGNSARSEGGGIYTGGSATFPVTLTNITLTANRANTGSGSYHGGGLFVSSGSPVLHNTLMAGNFNGVTGTTSDDVHGALNTGGDYNLIGDGTGMSGLTNGVNGNLVGSAAAPIDPLLGPLQDNGGPTKTHALLGGSPALNAGDPAQLGVADQRGVVRAGGVNIGAYQASASAFVVTVPGTVAAGMPFDVTVQAVDVFGQLAFGYRGTVTFSVTDPDPAVVLPADYTFTADDQGTHTFTGGFTLITLGPWTLTVADLNNGLSTDVMFTVNP